PPAPGCLLPARVLHELVFDQAQAGQPAVGQALEDVLVDEVLVFELVGPLAQELGCLAALEVVDEGEPGLEGAVDGLWFQDHVADALQEGVPPLRRELVDGALWSPALPLPLQRLDQALALELVEGVVQRPEVELDVPVEVLLPHSEGNLVRVKRLGGQQAEHSDAERAELSHRKYSNGNIPH